MYKIKKTPYLLSLIIFSLFFFLIINCNKKGNSHLSEEEKEIQDYENNTVIEKSIINNGITVEDLAYHWAPVHYQDVNPVDESGDSRWDYITRLDRDLPGQEGGIWDLEQNWDKNLSYPLRAYVYYSVVASDTHFFITYSFFHPWDTNVITQPTGVDIDWCCPTDEVCIFGECFCPLPKYPCDSEVETERVRTNWDTNDLEGVMFVVKRNGSYGDLEVVFAEAHGYILLYLSEDVDESPIYVYGEDEGDRFSHVASSRTRPFPLHYSNSFSDEAMESMDDDVLRIITTQEPEGHGAGVYPDWGAPSPGNPFYFYYYFGAHPGGGDHVRYIPSRDIAGIPVLYDIYYDENGNEKQGDNRFTYCKYKLINVFDPDGGLWYHRDEPEVFTGSTRTFIGHSTPLWNWRGNKPGYSEGDYPDFLENEQGVLLAQQNFWVSKENHPFTHNPAQLCWVFLPLKDATIAETQQYFSENYTWNNYLDDMLDGTRGGCWDEVNQCDKRPCYPDSCLPAGHCIQPCLYAGCD